ncbi:coproporphyrinogen III oxidase [Chitinispirillum alkaliphilum]|nr:coproporphyrinogen III oxidase [Chitinispirillum alkaliphilum]
MNSRPISLYIHVPFCVDKCRYCDFYSLPYKNEYADSYVFALTREWSLLVDRKSIDGNISTIFMGGGTPSLLTEEHWDQLNEGLFSRLNLRNLREWTLEVNPETFSEKKAALWKRMGVTRLTFGIQSMNKRELSVCGRIHTEKKALEVLSHPVLQEFNSTGADVMFALPGQTQKSLEHTLRTVLSCREVNHLSAYELTLNKSTPFGKHRKILPLPEEAVSLKMYKLIWDICSEYGLEQYEISNYSRKGHQSEHNKAYWNHSPYIGLGPAAHSYVHPLRWSNTNNLEEYISSIGTGKLPISFSEEIGPNELASEMIFLRLRKNEGLDEIEYFEKTGYRFADGNRVSLLRRLSSEQMILHEGNRWILTRKGRLFADKIASDLMF